MGEVAAAAAGVAVVGGIFSDRASKRAAKSNDEAAEASIAFQREQLAATRADQKPFLDAGSGVLDPLSAQALNVGPAGILGNSF